MVTGKGNAVPGLRGSQTGDDHAGGVPCMEVGAEGMAGQGQGWGWSWGEGRTWPPEPSPGRDASGQPERRKDAGRRRREEARQRREGAQIVLGPSRVARPLPSP